MTTTDHFAHPLTRLDSMPPEELAFELTSGKVMRATKDSAALDLFYSGTVPLFITDRVTAIPTGVRSKFTPGLVAIIKEKSGLALKGIEIKAGVIDADYRDEWIVLARNPISVAPWDESTGINQLDKDWKPFRLNPGDKIAQFLLIQLPIVHVYALSGAEIIVSDVIRTGGFGSTDVHAPLPGDPVSTDSLLIPKELSETPSGTFRRPKV